MTTDTDDVLAAEYVLGTLPAPERRNLERRVPMDAQLRTRIEDWERRLGPLAEDLAPEAPPAAVWAAIEARVSVSGESRSEAITVRPDQGLWRMLLPGVEIKVLWQDRSADRRSYFLRLAPGAVLPAHGHTAVEECLMLEGDLELGETRLTKGDYHRVPAGIPHPQGMSVGGCVAFVRGEIDLRAA